MDLIYNIQIHYTIPNTKYNITIIIPMTRTIEPITYSSLAGSEGTNLFKTNKIIPIIINAIPVSNDTISISIYIQKDLYHLSNIKRKKFSYNLSFIFYAYLLIDCLSAHYRQSYNQIKFLFLKYYSKIVLK